MSLPIPQPPPYPLLGNITDVDPQNGIASFMHLADKYGEFSISMASVTNWPVKPAGSTSAPTLPISADPVPGPIYKLSFFGHERVIVSSQVSSSSPPNLVPVIPFKHGSVVRACSCIPSPLSSYPTILIYQRSSRNVPVAVLCTD